MDKEIKEPVSAQRRRGANTKRKILQATKTLFANADFQSITLDQVAQAVGVSRTSILWHFDSKEGLLVAAALDFLEEMDNAVFLEKPALLDRADRITYLLDVVAAYFEQNPGAKGIVLSLIFNSQTPASIRNRIVEHMHADQHRLIEFLSTDEQVLTEQDTAAIVALFHGCYIQWYLAGCPNDFRARLKSAFDKLSL